MSQPWIPRNWEEACKRNAGRRKLHMRKRKERANRIVRMLGAMEVAPELRESAYGWLSVTAETMKKSKATASRDFAIARRIHFQFARMFGRTLRTQKGSGQVVLGFFSLRFSHSRECPGWTQKTCRGLSISYESERN